MFHKVSTTSPIFKAWVGVLELDYGVMYILKSLHALFPRCLASAISNYFRMTEVADQMKARPVRSSLQKNGSNGSGECQGTAFPGPGPLPLRWVVEERHADLASSPLPATAEAPSWKISAPEAGWGHNVAPDAAGAGSVSLLPTAPNDGAPPPLAKPSS